MSKPLISLGDALRAAADLKPADNATRTAILKMLGLETQVTTPAQKSIGAWKPSSTESVATAQRQAGSEAPARFAAPSAPPEQQAATPAHRPSVKVRITQTRQGAGVFEPPQWLSEPGDFLESESESGVPPPTPALFRRVVRRGILSATVSTPVPEGDLDFARILRTLGAGRPLEFLPRLPTATLRRGVQVLVDRSPAMDPFQQDQRDLIKALDDILANDRLSVLHFAGSPLRNVGAGPRATWKPWEPPAQNTPILAVTDLGIGGPLLDPERAPASEWLRFALRVRSHGHLLIALVPYEALRWPPTLARVMSIIHWSERTTVGEIRRAIRDAWRRLR